MGKTVIVAALDGTFQRKVCDIRELGPFVVDTLYQTNL